METCKIVLKHYIIRSLKNRNRIFSGQLQIGGYANVVPHLKELRISTKDQTLYVWEKQIQNTEKRP